MEQTAPLASLMAGIPAEEINDAKALRRYLESFHPNHPYPPITKENAEEIINTVLKVLAPYARGDHGRELQQHYTPDIETLQRAYLARDFEKEFPQGLASLIISLAWEPKQGPLIPPPCRR